MYKIVIYNRKSGDVNIFKNYQTAAEAERALTKSGYYLHPQSTGCVWVSKNFNEKTDAGSYARIKPM